MEIQQDLAPTPDISVVIPVRDEEANIRPLADRLRAVFTSMAATYEIIFVTDINHDRTVEVIEAASKEDPRVGMVKLANAFGHHAAAYAGLSYARGSAVVMMDGDLQDQPEDIPRLHERISEGFDVVYGIKERKNESSVRNLLSKGFVRCLRLMSDYPLDVNTSMFRVITRRVRDAVMMYRESSPSLTFVMGLIGFPTTQVLVTSAPRADGVTKYGLGRQINLAVNSIVSFSTKPLRIISVLGLTISFVSLLYSVVVIAQRLLLGSPVLGWSTIVGLMCALSGFQLMALGIMGEYVARVFLETKRRPLFIVERTIGVSGPPRI